MSFLSYFFFIFLIVGTVDSVYKWSINGCNCVKNDVYERGVKLSMNGVKKWGFTLSLVGSDR